MWWLIGKDGEWESLGKVLSAYLNDDGIIFTEQKDKIEREGFLDGDESVSFFNIHDKPHFLALVYGVNKNIIFFFFEIP